MEGFWRMLLAVMVLSCLRASLFLWRLNASSLSGLQTVPIPNIHPITKHLPIQTHQGIPTFGLWPQWMNRTSLTPSHNWWHHREASLRPRGLFAPFISCYCCGTSFSAQESPWPLATHTQNVKWGSSWCAEGYILSVWSTIKMLGLVVQACLTMSWGHVI